MDYTDDSEGWPSELFEDEVEEDYICAICSEVLRGAIETDCGHAYCENCITEWLKHHSTCPVDNMPLKTEQLRAMNRDRRKILGLKVKCPSCQKVMALKDFKAGHLECTDQPEPKSEPVAAAPVSTPSSPTSPQNDDFWNGNGAAPEDFWEPAGAGASAVSGPESPEDAFKRRAEERKRRVMERKKAEAVTQIPDGGSGPPPPPNRSSRGVSVLNPPPPPPKKAEQPADIQAEHLNHPLLTPASAAAADNAGLMFFPEAEVKEAELEAVKAGDQDDFAIDFFGDMGAGDGGEQKKSPKVAAEDEIIDEHDMLGDLGLGISQPVRRRRTSTIVKQDPSAGPESPASLPPPITAPRPKINRASFSNPSTPTTAKANAEAKSMPTAEPKPEPVNENEWICSKCTYENKDITAKKCGVCGTKREVPSGQNLTSPMGGLLKRVSSIIVSPSKPTSPKSLSLSPQSAGRAVNKLDSPASPNSKPHRSLSAGAEDMLGVKGQPQRKLSYMNKKKSPSRPHSHGNVFTSFSLPKQRDPALGTSGVYGRLARLNKVDRAKDIVCTLSDMGVTINWISSSFLKNKKTRMYKWLDSLGCHFQGDIVVISFKFAEDDDEHSLVLDPNSFSPEDIRTIVKAGYYAFEIEYMEKVVGSKVDRYCELVADIRSTIDQIEQADTTAAIAISEGNSAVAKSARAEAAEHKKKLITLNADFKKEVGDRTAAKKRDYEHKELLPRLKSLFADMEKVHNELLRSGSESEILKFKAQLDRAGEIIETRRQVELARQQAKR